MSNLNVPQVKPLRVMMDTWALEEKLNPVRRHQRPSHLFFGSNAYYVFFRLHQFLYERLATAKNLAYKSRRTSSKKKVPVTGDDRYARFCSLLNELVDGEGLEANKFEDELRNLLGASSYILFTIDKLISQLVKQSLALINSEVSLQLLSLYEYELKRSKIAGACMSLESSAQYCRMYHSNCQAILADNNCVQIEYFLDTHELGLGLIEGLSQSEPKPISEDWSMYLMSFISAIPTANEISLVPQPSSSPLSPTSLPFLIRSIKSFAKARNSSIYSPTLGQRALEECFVQNNLEINIDVRSYKMAFVEDTEDILIRTIKRDAAKLPLIEKIRKERQNAFQNWYERVFDEKFPNYQPPETQEVKQETDTDLHAEEDLEGEETIDMETDNAAAALLSSSSLSNGPTMIPTMPSLVSAALTAAVAAASREEEESDASKLAAASVDASQSIVALSSLAVSPPEAMIAAATVLPLMNATSPTLPVSNPTAPSTSTDSASSSSSSPYHSTTGS
jgi:hypothetical protein